MTKEELKKEAIQYAVDYPTSYGKGYKHKDLRVAYLAGAEPREKRIAELEAYNEKLLNGDIEKHNKIVELQAQIEKMKCCSNCKNCRRKFIKKNVFEYTCKVEHCKNYDKWEVRK